jgi:hypothetical protein
MSRKGGHRFTSLVGGNLPRTDEHLDGLRYEVGLSLQVRHVGSLSTPYSWLRIRCSKNILYQHYMVQYRGGGLEERSQGRDISDEPDGLPLSGFRQ